MKITSVLFSGIMLMAIEQTAAQGEYYNLIEVSSEGNSSKWFQLRRVSLSVGTIPPQNNGIVLVHSS
jgi:hypothetical protein